MYKLTLPSVVKDDRKQLKCLNHSLAKLDHYFFGYLTDGETKPFAFQKAEVATV